MKQVIKTICIFTFTILMFSSCQKVINVNLNSAATKYVITGNVTDQPGPYTVSVTQTKDFSANNTFTGISNAAITITDSNTGQTDTLVLASAGRYQTHMLTGIPGHTYQLSVAIGNDKFQSSSSMPQPVAIDSMRTVNSSFGNNINVIPYYKDPVQTGNYYHLVLTVQDSVSTNIYIHSDALVNGEEVSSSLDNDIDVHSGDLLTIELQCVDKNVYTYYRTLSQTIQQNSATPANPETNITGGALGYFSAHTVNRKSITAP